MTKGPNVTLWDDKKGTESQEYIKREERKLLAIVDERARKREEDEAKKKKEHPLKPFKLEKRQSVGRHAADAGRQVRRRRDPHVNRRRRRRRSFRTT